MDVESPSSKSRFSYNKRPLAGRALRRPAAASRSSTRASTGGNCCGTCMRFLFNRADGRTEFEGFCQQRSSSSSNFILLRTDGCLACKVLQLFSRRSSLSISRASTTEIAAEIC
ncbi:unnamed protein product [Calypogeia fissa]